jgi:hypothetical protein
MIQTDTGLIVCPAREIALTISIFNRICIIKYSSCVISEYDEKKSRLTSDDDADDYWKELNIEDNCSSSDRIRHIRSVVIDNPILSLSKVSTEFDCQNSNDEETYFEPDDYPDMRSCFISS